MKKTIFLLGSIFLFSCTNSHKQNEALVSAKKIADKIIEETSFEFQETSIGTNLGITQLELKPGETLEISLSNTGETKNGFLALAYQGSIKLQLNGFSLFSGTSEKSVIKEYTYNRYRFQEKLALKWEKGENIILVKNISNSGRILLLPVNEIDEADAQIKTNTPSMDIGIKQLVIDPDNSFTRDSYADWHYANGGTMLGMLHLYEASKDPKYLDFVKTFADVTIENKAYFEKQFFEKFAMRGSYHRIFRKTMLDDTGGPALPFAELSANYGEDENYMLLLEEMLDYVLNQQERLEDGTLCRPEPQAQSVWADDLFMSVPFLLRMAKINCDTTLYDEVARQIILFNKHLKNPETGLYFHGYYHHHQENTPVQWGRANGWVVWATSEALLKMPKDHPQYKIIENIFKQHISAILSYQDQTGMWHQVLNAPETYLETSCTAMFTLAAARGIKMGILDEDYKSNALKAWAALENKILDDGAVTDICRGTGIGGNIEFYEARKRFDHDPRGLGAMLTAACEISSL